ncbi:MAG: T9SS type A sorting domain-containing protein [Saprospirales bacterium]|nr:T9SS type A sorting domain-containing protein [Saprospirales bacterium]
MKPNHIFILLFFLVSIGLTGLPAQSAIVSTGRDVTTDGGFVSYTVGQTAYLAITVTNGSVYQGVQQPFYIIVGVEEASTLTKFCTLYPNPSDGDVTLKVEGIPAKDLEYQLYDLKGQLIERNRLWTNEMIIPMQHLDAGTYLLNLHDNFGACTTFKIIKTQ